MTIQNPNGLTTLFQCRKAMVFFVKLKTVENYFYFTDSKCFPWVNGCKVYFSYFVLCSVFYTDIRFSIAPNKHFKNH